MEACDVVLSKPKWDELLLLLLLSFFRCWGAYGSSGEGNDVCDEEPR